jgi:hypothetical protein
MKKVFVMDVFINILLTQVIGCGVQSIEMMKQKDLFVQKQ